MYTGLNANLIPGLQEQRRVQQDATAAQQAAAAAKKQAALSGTVQQATSAGGLDPSANPLSWLQSNPSFMDFLARNQYGMQSAMTGNDQSLQDALAMPGFGVGRQLGIGGSGAMGMGMASLAELIFGQGKTNPASMNRNLSAIGRDTQGSVQDIGDEAARRGLGGSGLAMALQGAAQGSGASRMAGARADETARSEDRRRQDLALLGDLVIGPSLQSAGIASGVASQGADRKVAEDQAKRQQQAAMISMMASLFGGMCWVARAVYGDDDPRWLLARRWMLTRAPVELLARYLAYGPSLAERVRRSPRLRQLLRPAFDRMIAEVG